MPDRVISVPQATQIATRIKNKFDTVNGRLQQDEDAIDRVEEKTDIYGQVIDIEQITESVDVSGAVRIPNKTINNYRNQTSSSVGSILYFTVTESGTYHLTPSTTSQFNANIYQNVTQDSDIKSANWVKSMTRVNTTTREAEEYLEAGQTIVASAFDGSYTFTLGKIVGGTATIKSTVQLTAAQAAEVDGKIKTVTDELLDDGLISLNPNVCALHAWDSYTHSDNRNYRVRITDDITFAYDCYVLMAPGFNVAGYDETGTGLGGLFATLKLEKGVKYHLYIRRSVEDSSETADIEEFAAALKFTTSLSPIELYKPTFTDVSMFPRIGVCGDSYASGGGIISGVRPLTWGKCLERQTGVAVDIYAKSGQSVMQWVEDTTNGLPALLAGEECGMYWMQHGINGTGTDETLGTAADMSASPRPNTFYGQYTEAVMQMKEHFPYARIVLATIVGSSWMLAHEFSRYVKANAAIRAIAEYCEVPCIETASDEFYRTYFYSLYTRSNHPTAMQNAGIAMANRRLISKCIQENPDYFVEFGSNW